MHRILHLGIAFLLLEHDARIVPGCCVFAEQSRNARSAFWLKFATVLRMVGLLCFQPGGGAAKGIRYVFDALVATVVLASWVHRAFAIAWLCWFVGLQPVRNRLVSLRLFADGLVLVCGFVYCGICVAGASDLWLSGRHFASCEHAWQSLHADVFALLLRLCRDNLGIWASLVVRRRPRSTLLFLARCISSVGRFPSPHALASR